MTRLRHRLILAAGATLATVLAAFAPADDPAAAEAVLTGQGLARAGNTYSLEAEKPVLAKIAEFKPVFAKFAAAIEQQNAVEQDAARMIQLEQQRILTQANIENLTAQVNNMIRPSTSGNNRVGQNQYANEQGTILGQRRELMMSLGPIGQEADMIRLRQPSQRAKDDLAAELKARREEYTKAAKEVRPMVADVLKKYDEVAKDDKVKAALSELKRTKLAKLKIGPSDPFVAAVRQLDQAERMIPTGGKTSMAGPSRKTGKGAAKKK